MAQKTKKSLKKSGILASAGKSFGLLLSNRAQSTHKTFSLTKTYKAHTTQPKVTGTTLLLLQSVKFYNTHWRVFLGLTILYLLLLWVIQGLPNQQTYSEYKNLLQDALGGNLSNFSGVGVLLAGALGGTISPELSDLQRFLNVLTTLLFWLIFIWAARHLMAKNNITIRQALYNAPTPLIPLIIIVIILTLQLIPAAVGMLFLSYSFGGEAAIVTGVEAMLFSIASFLLIVLSVYMLLRTLFGLIIVTLPNMYPMAALATAKTLVMNKRFLILRRFTALGILLLLLWLLVLIPVIYLDTFISSEVIPTVPLVLNLLSAFSLPIVIIYLYRLYRELL